MAEPTASTRRTGLLYGAAGAVVLAVIALPMAVSSRARLTGKTPQERIACICRLADLQPRGAVEALAAAAINEPDVGVRRAALIGLGRFRSPAARRAVEDGTKDKSASVRAAAAATLGLCNDDDAAARLGDILAGDPQEEVRLSAVAGLGRIGRPKAVAVLVEAMERNDSTNVRREALVTLLKRFQAGFTRPPDPRDTAKWGELMRQVRRMPSVKAAMEDDGAAGGAR